MGERSLTGLAFGGSCSPWLGWGIDNSLEPDSSLIEFSSLGRSRKSKVAALLALAWERKRRHQAPVLQGCCLRLIYPATCSFLFVCLCCVLPSAVEKQLRLRKPQVKVSHAPCHHACRLTRALTAQISVALSSPYARQAVLAAARHLWLGPGGCFSFSAICEGCKGAACWLSKSGQSRFGHVESEIVA